MNDPRDVMARARSLLDPENIARQEAEHAAWRAEHADALEDARIEALIAKPPAIKQRRLDDDRLIYKVVVNERAPAQATTTMSPELQRQWNAWADERISHAVETTAQIVGQEVGKIERGILAKYDAQIAELFAGLAALRLEVEQMRKKKKPNA